MITELAILGAITSILTQVLKQYFNSKLASLAVLVAVSIVVAIGVALLQQYNLWQWFLGIMGSASLVYAFILQHMEPGYKDFLQQTQP